MTHHSPTYGGSFVNVRNDAEVNSTVFPRFFRGALIYLGPLAVFGDRILYVNTRTNKAA
jgi:hypothetical protein